MKTMWPSLMTWTQVYTPVAGSLALSTLVAAVPIVVLLGLLGILQVRAHIAALAGLLSALLIAVLVYGMPAGLAAMSAVYGTAFGLFPIISPDGKKVLFNRGAASWSRRHYNGADSRDVWLFDRATRTFAQLTKRPGNDGRARWIDNESFVFASDKDA